MKYTMKNLRKLYAGLSDGLYKQVIADCIDNYSDGYTTYLKDVVDYGTNTRTVTELIYNSDRYDFFRTYYEDIREVAIRLMEDYGKPLVGKNGIFTDLDCADYITKSEEFQLKMTVVAYEQVSYDIYYNIFGGDENGNN